MCSSRVLHRQDFPDRLQKCNDLTGEHSCIMLKCLNENTWLAEYFADFRRRFTKLLPKSFKKFSAALGLSTITNSHIQFKKTEINTSLIEYHFTGHDMKRIELYTRQMADYHLLSDLAIDLADLYFHSKIDTKLDALQQAILIGFGLQSKDMDTIASEIGLPTSQLLAKFFDLCKKLYTTLNSLLEDNVAKKIGFNNLSEETLHNDGPLQQTLDDELTKAAKELQRKQRQEVSKLIGEELQQYKIKGSDMDWEQALSNKGKTSHLISVKSGIKRLGEENNDISDSIPMKKNKKSKHKNKFKSK